MGSSSDPSDAAQALRERTASRASSATPLWKISESEELYQVAAWGGGYFAINSRGRLDVRPGMTGPFPITYMFFTALVTSARPCNCSFPNVTSPVPLMSSMRTMRELPVSAM